MTRLTHGRDSRAVWPWLATAERRYHQMPLETSRKNRTIYCAFLKMTTTVRNQAAAFFYLLSFLLHDDTPTWYRQTHNSHSEKPQDNDGSVFRPAR